MFKVKIYVVTKIIVIDVVNIFKCQFTLKVYQIKHDYMYNKCDKMNYKK
jgi:hypothetical protein